MILAPTCRRGADAGRVRSARSRAGRLLGHRVPESARRYTHLSRALSSMIPSLVCQELGRIPFAIGRRETPHVQPEAIIVGRPPRNTAYAVAFGAARRPVDTLPPCRRATQGCAPAARVPETTPVGAQLARGNKAVGRRALKVTLPPPHLRFTAIASQWRGAL